MDVQIFKNNKWLKALVGVLAAVLALWAISWAAVPALLRSQGQKIATEKLGRQVTIGKVDFSPWSLELTVHDLAIAQQGSSQPQLQIKRIYIDAELQSLFRLAPVLDAIEVDAPVAVLRRTAPGQTDIDDVIAKLDTPSDPDSKPVSFALYNIALKNGALSLDDAVTGQKHELKDLDLSVPFLSNFESKREVKVAPHLAFALNGSSFDSNAQSTPFVESHQTDAVLSFKALDISPYLPYLPKSLPVQLDSAVLDAEVKIDFVQTPQVAVKLTGQASASHIKLRDRADRDLLALKTLSVELLDVQPLANKVHLGKVTLDGVEAALLRDAKGQINVLTLAGAPAAVDKDSKTGAAPAAVDAAQAHPLDLSIAELQLQQSQISWRDDSLPAPAQIYLRDVSLDATAIALPFKAPLQFKGSAKVQAALDSEAAGVIEFAGEATDQLAKVDLQVKDVPLQWAAPYTQGVVRPQLAGLLNSKMQVNWTAPDLQLNISQLTVDKVQWACGAARDCTVPKVAGLSLSGKGMLVDLKKLTLEDTTLDLSRHTVKVGRLALLEPRALVERAADGRWMFESWQVTPPAGKNAAAPAVRKPAASAQAAWAVDFSQIDVDGGSVAYQDSVNARPVAAVLTGLQLRLKDFTPLATQAKPSSVSFSARIGAGRVDPGRLQYTGMLGLAPLSVQGKVIAKQLPVHAFEPYFGDALNIDIRRADASFTGQVSYSAPKAGPQLRVQGDASLDDVHALAIEGSPASGQSATAPRGLEQGDDLLKWKQLGLRGVDVAMVPGKPLNVSVRETALSDFFARVVIKENGRLNLQDLVKSSAQEAEAAAAPANSAAASKDSVPADASKTAAAVDPNAPVIRSGPIVLVNGQVQFADHFIKPNYSADLSALNGRLSAFSSVPAQGTAEPDMAELELRGRAEGTAPLEITGKLNPLAQPLALDIQAHMTDLELPPLSPYSIKYAGHGIEKGKLSMDVFYKIDPDGQLTARNKLVLNQLSFGDAVAGAPASLPVRLAVALLADRNGVIDLDVPLSGSLNDPQFRWAPLIFKVIGNLITKAVTAPFSLLMGGGAGNENLGEVLFTSGSAQLSESARQGLSKAVKALTDRPSLKMTVIGYANEKAEREDWRHDQLQQLVVAQKRRASSTKAGATAADAAPVEVSAAEYPALLKEVYRRADITKPRNLVGMAKDLPVAEMEALLLAQIKVPENAMRDLAVARGVAVRDYLASQQLPMERVFLGAVKLSLEEGPWKPHVELSLDMR